eukprot:6199076-Pleurochrysis_carterae.AAC.1
MPPRHLSSPRLSVARMPPMQLLQMLLTLLVLPLGTWAHVLRPQAVVARAMRAMPAVSSRAVPRCPVAVLSAAETTTAPVSFVQTEMRSACASPERPPKITYTVTLFYSSALLIRRIKVSCCACQ